jgi:hypothetical protein
MALSRVQFSGSANALASNAQATVTTPTTGNLLLAYVILGDAATRTFTLSDDVGGGTGWTQIVYYNPGRGVGLWYKQDVPAGITWVRATLNTGSQNIFLLVSEYAGFGTSTTIEATDTFTDAGNTNSHKCSSAGISSSNPCFAFLVGYFSSVTGVTDVTATGGYTEETNATTVCRMYQDFPSGVTANTGPWNSSGTARTGSAAMGLLSAGAAPSSGQPTMRRWGGTPYMGGQGINQASSGKGQMWGRSRSGRVIVPAWLKDQEAA